MAEQPKDILKRWVRPTAAAVSALVLLAGCVPPKDEPTSAKPAGQASQAQKPNEPKKAKQNQTVYSLPKTWHPRFKFFLGNSKHQAYESISDGVSSNGMTAAKVEILTPDGEAVRGPNGKVIKEIVLECVKGGLVRVIDGKESRLYKDSLVCDDDKIGLLEEFGALPDAQTLYPGDQLDDLLPQKN